MAIKAVACGEEQSTQADTQDKSTYDWIQLARLCKLCQVYGIFLEVLSLRHCLEPHLRKENKIGTEEEYMKRIKETERFLT